ncbi:MAG: GNAT family N-acetyltransferase [Janthinobacterium lividum]
MNMTVILAAQDEVHVIANLWPLYLYDVLEFEEALPNAHGLFEEETLHTYDYAVMLRVWWEKPGLLFPFLIRVDGHAAGFALVGASPGHAPQGRDFFVHEFFLMRPFRGRGVAEAAVREVFESLRGRWELRTSPSNVRAKAFWRKTLSHYTAEQFTEEVRHTLEDDAVKVVFCFSNGAADQ